MSDQQAIGFKI